ncbi:DNA primase, partial [Candidatus Gottesmanbacteria bacterium]|nr:DNA primase [Candidatus Gottesmanbacteria bacterium]
SPERQIWHCFGGCQDGGDIFKFLMRVENLEFPEALKILAQRAGVNLTSYQPTKNSEIKDKIYAVNKLASEYYHYILTTHVLGKNAKEYLENRKININSIKFFGLGYAPNSWDSLIKFLQKKKYSVADLETAGVISKSGIGHYFDRFRGRIIFPLFDHRGNVCGFAGRLLDPDAKEAKYINTAETLVYIKGNILYGLNIAKEEIKKAGFAVVVEGEIDAIQSYQAGVRNVVAIKGSALTTGHVNLFKRYTENIALSLDADFAGDAAAHRGIEIADQAGLNIKVVTFTQGKDPDELIKKDPKLWRNAVEKAGPFYDYIIDSALEKFDPAAPDGAKKIVTEVAKFLIPIENLVVKNHYLKKLAKKLDISQNILEEQLTRELKKISNPLATKTQSLATGKPRSELLEEYLLSLLLQSAKPSDYLLLISPRLRPEDFTVSPLGQIYALLLEKDKITPPPELLDLVNRLSLQENKVQAELLAEIQKTVWEIKELSLREKLKKIGEEIKKTPDEEKLEQEFVTASYALQKLREEKELIDQS